MNEFNISGVIILCDNTNMPDSFIWSVASFKENQIAFLHLFFSFDFTTIMPAGKEDIAVNFIILPEFFDYALQMMEEDENLLREFIINCLRGRENASSYLHFKV